MKIALLFSLVVLFSTPAAANGASIRPVWDYQYLIGSGEYEDLDNGAESGSQFAWFRNGIPFTSGTVPQSFYFSADGDTTTSDEQAPIESKDVKFAEGKWGSACFLLDKGLLAYDCKNNITLDEGTIEMWVAIRADGKDPVYTSRSHILFQYVAKNNEYIEIVQSSRDGVIYFGGFVGGKWQSAYGSRSSMSNWKAGDWHHIACTYSATRNRMRFYVDGFLTADSNENHYWPPPATADRFYLGGSRLGEVAHYLIDEVQILACEANETEIRTRSIRLSQPGHGEVWLPTNSITPGDSIVFQYTPSNGTYMGEPQISTPYTFPGIPLIDPYPLSTLLEHGMSTVLFSIKSIVPTSCRYSIGQPLSYAEMTPFESGQKSTVHQTHLQGLDTNTLTVNSVYVRCETYPDYLVHLRYRCMPAVNQRYPRTGNLWGSWWVREKGLEYLSKIDLWQGADFTGEEIVELRKLNPSILILTSVNTVENAYLPEPYYLKDTNGNKIEVWPGGYRLNLTKLEVAVYQAQFAYQRILDSGLLVDGCFFDNFFLTQSWLSKDIYGREVKLDANEDGLEDDPVWLDKEWRKGVLAELREWRRLMPYALATGHLPGSSDQEVPEIFNGDSIGFRTAAVLDGRNPFSYVWDFYHDWCNRGREPEIVMIESSPHNQISYGYDYMPMEKIPPSTLEFARTYYPYVRFGLTLTLMNDGYFAHEFGDTWHGNDWWYDELDYNLGHSMGPYQRVPMEITSHENLLDNGSFENELGTTWRLGVNAGSGSAATLTREITGAVVGNACAHIMITNKGQGVSWHIEFNQRDRSLKAGILYDLSFWVKSDHERSIELSSQKSSPDWRNYGLRKEIIIGTQWEKHTVTFKASETANDARIQFFLGKQTGDVWFDDIQLTEHPADVFRRDFENGIALLNGTNERVTMNLEPGFRRLQGEQAPRYQYILDDTPDVFSGTWQQVTKDSGEWKAIGPFYHDWGPYCHQMEGNAGSAEWNLSLRADDTYTIQAWWPASPDAGSWSKSVVYEVLADGICVASATVDQSKGGDEWHTICTVPLYVKSLPSVRIRNEGTGKCIADALHIFSVSRYNDGSDADSVTLEPLDGIILQRRPLNLMDNGSFENELGDTWRLGVYASSGSAATLKRETGNAVVGNACAHIMITNKGQGISWHIEFNQRDRSLQVGVDYDLSFWVKSDRERTIELNSQKGSPDWRNYGLWKEVIIGTQWKKHTVTFKARETANDARIQFFLGKQTGDVWLDDIQLTPSFP